MTAVEPAHTVGARCLGTHQPRRIGVLPDIFQCHWVHCAVAADLDCFSHSQFVAQQLRSLLNKTAKVHLPIHQARTKACLSLCVSL